MAGLFDTFTVAKRGLNVQQGAINTTAHNISNANTEGFSRQRVVIETTRPFGGTSKFDICTVGQVGTGAEITNIMRIRDSFIDYQIRSETSKLGQYDVESNFLSQIEDVFGEPSDTGIQTLFSEFYSAFQELSKTPDKSTARTVALQKASSLASALNQTYTQLEKKNTEAQELLQQNVSDINSLLDQINELNQQISQVCAVGQTPNDLMDSRDNLLDQLSSLFGINIDKDKRETINLTVDGFETDSKLVSSKPNDQYSRFSYVKNAEVYDYVDKDGNNVKALKVEYYALGDSTSSPVEITVTGDEADLNKIKSSLEQNRIIVGNEKGLVVAEDGTTEMKASDFKKLIFASGEEDSKGNKNKIVGEVSGNQEAQNLTKGYMDDLDNIAKALAYSVNAIQTGSTDGTNNNGYELLFVTSNEGTKTDEGISAKNIKVNQALIDDVYKLNCSSSDDAGERNGDRAQAIANLLSTKFDVGELGTVTNRDEFFNKSGASLSDDGVNIKGSETGKTTSNYYKDMISTLGTKAQEANRRATNQSDVILKNLNLQRLSVSGVSLDEEMTNLIQFQHAYSANAKMISTVDELLDVVINGLKR